MRSRFAKRKLSRQEWASAYARSFLLALLDAPRLWQGEAVLCLAAATGLLDIPWMVGAGVCWALGGWAGTHPVKNYLHEVQRGED